MLTANNAEGIAENAKMVSLVPLYAAPWHSLRFRNHSNLV
jgi:hypothetical protein